MHCKAQNMKDGLTEPAIHPEASKASPKVDRPPKAPKSDLDVGCSLA